MNAQVELKELIESKNAIAKSKWVESVPPKQEEIDAIQEKVDWLQERLESLIAKEVNAFQTELKGQSETADPETKGETIDPEPKDEGEEETPTLEEEKKETDDVLVEEEETQPELNLEPEEFDLQQMIYHLLLGLLIVGVIVGVTTLAIKLALGSWTIGGLVHKVAILTTEIGVWFNSISFSML
jgi:hypothetical protein